VIEFNSTTKTYKSILGRSVTAVEDFSLQVAEGEVLGIAGPNGAGKSTLISLLLGYIRPTKGSVTIEGMQPRAYVEKHGIGYLSELMTINPGWTAESALARFAVLAAIPPKEITARVDAVIEQLGIGEHKAKKVKALSKGNLQRLGLAQSLLREESVMILDEPTHGLDPVWTQRFRDIVEAMRRPGRTVIIASHNLDELQRLADRVAIIDHGRLQRLVTTGYDKSAETASVYRLSVAHGGERMAEIFPDAVDT
jgi:ABC-type multidrug transport system ATPase subunit